MTVMLMKLIEDVLALFRALCPCLFHDRQLLQSLTRTNKRKTGFNSTVGDPVVFIYPNMLHKDRGSSGASVYVKDPRTGRKKKVCTSMPNSNKSELLDCQMYSARHLVSSNVSCIFSWKLLMLVGDYESWQLPCRRASSNLQQEILANIVNMHRNRVAPIPHKCDSDSLRLF